MECTSKVLQHKQTMPMFYFLNPLLFQTKHKIVFRYYKNQFVIKKNYFNILTK